MQVGTLEMVSKKSNGRALRSKAPYAMSAKQTAFWLSRYRAASVRPPAMTSSSATWREWVGGPSGASRGCGFVFLLEFQTFEPFHSAHLQSAVLG
jgi:hypothetical protein